MLVLRFKNDIMSKVKTLVSQLFNVKSSSSSIDFTTFTNRFVHFLIINDLICDIPSNGNMGYSLDEPIFRFLRLNNPNNSLVLNYMYGEV